MNLDTIFIRQKCDKSWRIFRSSLVDFFKMAVDLRDSERLEQVVGLESDHQELSIWTEGEVPRPVAVGQNGWSALYAGLWKIQCDMILLNSLLAHNLRDCIILQSPWLKQ